MLLVGLEELRDDCWTVLVDAGVRLERADDVAGAMEPQAAVTAIPSLAAFQHPAHSMATAALDSCVANTGSAR